VFQHLSDEEFLSKIRIDSVYVPGAELVAGTKISAGVDVDSAACVGVSVENAVGKNITFVIVVAWACPTDCAVSAEARFAMAKIDPSILRPARNVKIRNSIMMLVTNTTGKTRLVRFGTWDGAPYGFLPYTVPSQRFEASNNSEAVW
jgi:hypothetical protein